MPAERLSAALVSSNVRSQLPAARVKFLLLPDRRRRPVTESGSLTGFGMRWSIIRLIWLRELRDQLRDRRTVFMIAVLPMLLYPILGVGVLQFALGFLRKQNTVGVYGSQYLPSAAGARPHPIAAASWLSLTPLGNPLGTTALVQASQFVRGSDYPPLLVESDGKTTFHSVYFDAPEDVETLQVKILGQDSGVGSQESGIKQERAADKERHVSPVPNPQSLIPNPQPPIPSFDRSPLESKEVDLLMVVPPDFQAELRQGRPTVYLLVRDNDDRSRLVYQRVSGVLNAW